MMKLENILQTHIEATDNTRLIIEGVMDRVPFSRPLTFTKTIIFAFAVLLASRHLICIM